MNGFKNGDRVVSLVDSPGNSYSIRKGDAGTICGFNLWREGWAGVCWDDLVEGGHDCCGTCEFGYGWHVPIDVLDFEDDDGTPPFQFDEEAFADLFK